MADPISQQVVDAIIGRLQAIQVDAGFRTDAGARVLHGKFGLDPDELTLAVLARKEAAEEDRGRNRILCMLEVQVEAQVPLAADDPGGARLEAVVADIQEAVEIPGDRNLGGLAPQGVSYSGRETVFPAEGAAGAYARMTYLVGYHRKYGNPAQRA